MVDTFKYRVQRRKPPLSVPWGARSGRMSTSYAPLGAGKPYLSGRVSGAAKHCGMNLDSGQRRTTATATMDGKRTSLSLDYAERPTVEKAFPEGP